MAHMVHGYLIALGGGDNIPLIRPVLTVGRRSSCDICLPFTNISSSHCELLFREGYWYVRDLDSTNGIKVNGMRVREKMLHPQDELSIAKRHYKIEYELPKERNALEEEFSTEEAMGQSLLEKAGLERRRRAKKGVSPLVDPNRAYANGDDDDD